MWLETVHVFGAMTVAMPMLCANGNVIRIPGLSCIHDVLCLVVFQIEYHLDVGVA